MLIPCGKLCLIQNYAFSISKSKSDIAYDIQTEVYVWSNTNTAIRESQLLNELKRQEGVKS